MLIQIINMLRRIKMEELLRRLKMQCSVNFTFWLWPWSILRIKKWWIVKLSTNKSIRKVLNKYSIGPEMSIFYSKIHILWVFWILWFMNLLLTMVFAIEDGPKILMQLRTWPILGILARGQIIQVILKDKWCLTLNFIAKLRFSRVFHGFT